MLTDPEFQRQRCAATGALESSVEITGATGRPGGHLPAPDGDRRPARLRPPRSSGPPSTSSIELPVDGPRRTSSTAAADVRARLCRPADEDDRDACEVRADTAGTKGVLDRRPEGRAYRCIGGRIEKATAPFILNAMASEQTVGRQMAEQVIDVIDNPRRLALRDHASTARWSASAATATPATSSCSRTPRSTRASAGAGSAPSWPAARSTTCAPRRQGRPAVPVHRRLHHQESRVRTISSGGRLSPHRRPAWRSGRRPRPGRRRRARRTAAAYPGVPNASPGTIATSASSRISAASSAEVCGDPAAQRPCRAGPGPTGRRRTRPAAPGRRRRGSATSSDDDRSAAPVEGGPHLGDGADRSPLTAASAATWATLETLDVACDCRLRRRLDHVGRADHPAHPPAGHGVGLGHPVEHDDLVAGSASQGDRLVHARRRRPGARRSRR